MGQGCFWGVALLLEKEFPALSKVLVGYQGGTTENPTYEQVCAKWTKHVEVVQCEWKEGEVDLEKLVTFFYRFHDPTTLNRQHNDVVRLFSLSLSLSISLPLSLPVRVTHTATGQQLPLCHLLPRR